MLKYPSLEEIEYCTLVFQRSDGRISTVDDYSVTDGAGKVKSYYQLAKV